MVSHYPGSALGARLDNWKGVDLFELAVPFLSTTINGLHYFVLLARLKVNIVMNSICNAEGCLVICMGRP